MRLRGVNVGGKNKLPMKAFAADLESLGCQAVPTYLQSGNAVFRSSQRSAGRLQQTITEQIETRHGFRPGVQTLAASQRERVIAAYPFPPCRH